MDRKVGAALAAVLGILLGATCTPQPLAPIPGLAAWREAAAFGVRDGVMDLAGGNLLLQRTDLTIETRLGPQAVTHVYNSATDRWTWSFEMTYAGGYFQDDTGAQHGVVGVWGPIQGTRWRAVDAATIESRGGLRFHFAPDGRLAQVAWRHASYPRLELQRPGDGTLHIAQCTAPGACADVFVVHYQGSEVTAISDRAGRRCAYGYAGGRLAWVQTPFDREQALPPRRYDYALGANGRPSQLVVTNPEQERARYELDGAGRVTAWTLLGEESPRWRFRYDASPLRTVASDPLGRETELRFDASRRLVELTRHAVGERTSFGWSGRRITRITAPDGLTTSARFDAADEPVEWTLASGRRLEAEYAPGAVNLVDPWTALPLRVRDADGVLVERAFDAQGRLASETNGAGERVAFHYGALETLARVDLPSGLSVRFAGYGEHGQPLEVRMPSPEAGEPDFVERREFDAVGDMTRGADPGSESGTQFPGVVARRFDSARHLRALVMSASPGDGTPQDVVFDRRSDGRLRAIQRPYGASTELDYDALGRLRAQRERVDGGWTATRLAWTPLGELARVERPNGMTQELGYDGAGRLVRRTNRRAGAFESEVRYAYEAGRLVRKDDTTVPGPTRISYDGRGRVRTVTWPDGEQSQLGYDGRDRPIRSVLLLADGRPLRQLLLRYDAAGRETQLVDGAAVVYEQIHANGRLAAIRHGNGVVRTLSYDEFGRPAGAVSRDAEGRIVETETVERHGRTLAGPDPNGPFRETHARYQATAAFGPVAFAEQAVGFRFNDGRRWPAGVAADSGTVEWCNGPQCGSPGDSSWFAQSGLMDLEWELLPTRGGEVRQERHFATNPERNRLREVVLRTITPGACSSCAATRVDVVEHRYAWDAAGFATSRDGVPIAWDATGHLASFGAATFEHDAEGRLRGSLVAGVARQRRFGGLVEADAAGNPVRIDLGAVEIDLAANRRSYRHFDWRGNVRSLWSDTGEIRAVREYGAYGPDRSHGEVGDPRGFAQGLETAGLVLLGERIYDPAARQFLSPDPVYGAVHQYVYGAGDPANYWDWTGRTARESAGFRIAGSFGELVGTITSIGVAAFLFPGNPLLAVGVAGIAAGPAGTFVRVLFEELYVLGYDWVTAPPPRTWVPHGPGGTHEWFLPRDLLPVSGPRPVGFICQGSECQPQYPGTGGPPPGRGGRPGSSLSFPAAAPSVGFGCGLVGVEALPLLAWLAIRKTRIRRRVPREGGHA